MEKRIIEVVKDRQAEYVLELILDNTKCSRIEGLDCFANLEVLSLNGCGLATLDGFPSLPRLSRLELADNRLKDGLADLAKAGLSNLKHLNLAGNTKFDDLEQLTPMAQLGLRSLDLYQCGVTKLENYRAESFKMIPSLKYLDGTDMNGNEEDEDEDEGEDEEGTEAEELDDEFTQDEEDPDEEDEDAAVASKVPLEEEEEEEEGEEGDDNDDDTEGSEVPLDYLLKEEGLTEDEADDDDFDDHKSMGASEDDEYDEDIKNDESPLKKARVADDSHHWPC